MHEIKFAADLSLTLGLDAIKPDLDMFAAVSIQPGAIHWRCQEVLPIAVVRSHRLLHLIIGGAHLSS